MAKRSVVVIGSGAREHALANVLGRECDVVVTPGSDGIPNSVPTPATELDADLFVVGPEQPLVEGLADQLRAQGKLVFGPGADGAMIEGSKVFMKEVITAAGVPTAKWQRFDNEGEAIAFLAELDNGYVIKTDGLAAGKGVLVTKDREEAVADIRSKLSGESFGESGTTLVVEELLEGPEFSVFAICCGDTAIGLGPSQDHKRIGDGDTGANTGGVGAYAPVDFLPRTIVDDVMASSVLPTLIELHKRGIDYRGVLYGSWMLTDSGPKLLEFNVRFGDPDGQVVLELLDSDLSQLLTEAALGKITNWPSATADSCVNVVLCAENYPATPRKGDVISGIDKAEQVEGVTILHAGTKKNENGEFVTNGGRVLDVMAVGPDFETARERAYQAVSYISWSGMHYRTDIGAQMKEKMK